MEKKLNLFLVFAVAAIAIVLLGAGEYGWKIMQEDIPFQKEVKQLNGVEGLRIERNFLQDTAYIISLSEVADWSKTHQSIIALAKKYEVAEESIEFSDRRGLKLESLYRYLNFSLQEGLQRGTFRSMQKEIKLDLDKAGLDSYQLVLNDEYLYLALSKGKEELYAVLARGGTVNEKRD